MTPDTSTLDPTELEQIKAQVAALQAAKDREESQKAAVAEAHRVPPAPKVSPDSLAGRRLHYQDQVIRVRNEALAEVDAANEQHLASVGTKRAELETQLLELAGRFREEQDRHTRALAPITARQAKVRKEMDGLMKPPVTFEQAMAKPERQAELERLADEHKRASQTPGAEDFEDVRYWDHRIGRWAFLGRRKRGKAAVR